MNVEFKILADREQRRGRTVGHFFVSLLLAWVFVGTIDGPVINLQSDSGPGLVKVLKLPNPERPIHSELQSVGLAMDKRPPVNVSFLLFDFKQDLRHWPNVFGNISRSPPLLFSF